MISRPRWVTCNTRHLFLKSCYMSKARHALAHRTRAVFFYIYLSSRSNLDSLFKFSTVVYSTVPHVSSRLKCIPHRLSCQTSSQNTSYSPHHRYPRALITANGGTGSLFHFSAVGSAFAYIDRVTFYPGTWSRELNLPDMQSISPRSIRPSSPSTIATRKIEPPCFI